MRAVEESAIQSSADAIERTIALLEHMRVHTPLEFCGLQSAQEFLKLVASLAGACAGLTAAWLISTTTAPVIQMTKHSATNWTTDIGTV